MDNPEGEDRAASPESDIDEASYKRYTSHLQHPKRLLKPLVAMRRIQPPKNIDVHVVSNNVKERNIKPPKLTFGFLGVGYMGSCIIKNLAHTGHAVVIWNRTIDKCNVFKELGVQVEYTPSDVVNAADVIFCCVKDSIAASSVVYDSLCGVSMVNKAYVEMSSIDPQSSQNIFDQIVNMGGKYLEVRFQGSRQDAIDGNLVVIASGDNTVFRDCETCFRAMASEAIFLCSEVGAATKINSILQMMNGVQTASLVDGLALARKLNMEKDLINCLMKSKLKCPLFEENWNAITENNYTRQSDVENIQKNIMLAQNEAAQNNMRLPLAAAVNELYVHAKRMGYSECDPVALCKALRLELPE